MPEVPEPRHPYPHGGFAQKVRFGLIFLDR
jgi:hypothetical protein